MSTDIRWKQRFGNFQRAFSQLEKAVQLKKPDELQEQGMIQCFEYSFELAWKTLQDYLSTERGYTEIRGPRLVIEQAYQDGLIQNGISWMEMLQSRNLTSHLYDEKEVKKIVEKIKTIYFFLLKGIKNFFEEKK